MNRDFCARCSIKHLGKAKILMDEAKLDYPFHVWIALANMSEAEDEILAAMPEEARLIRSVRKQIENDLANDTVKTYDFRSLCFAVAKGAMLEEVLYLDPTLTPQGDK